MKTLSDAFHHTLQDVYFAEQAITKALPDVISAVSSKDLKAALEHHLEETRQQIETLGRVFASVGEQPSGQKCAAMAGLIKECDGVIGDATGAPARNAAVIGCCQAIEHYEIARYGTLREWAKALGHTEAHELLTGILDQEKKANHTLTHLAVTSINQA
ncbi:MAG: ferritin-like domain-containing protein [Vicinamibacterales bacterium]